MLRKTLLLTACAAGAVEPDSRRVFVSDRANDRIQVFDENGTYQLSEEQARAILELRLHRLTGLERDKIAGDLRALVEMAKRQQVDPQRLHLQVHMAHGLGGVAVEQRSVAAAQPEESPAAARDTLIQSFVTVYERDGAARIAFRQPVSTSGAFYWWTGDDTAVADADYIALEPPVLAFASGEEAETLHVPLVNDSLPRIGLSHNIRRMLEQSRGDPKVREQAISGLVEIYSERERQGTLIEIHRESEGSFELSWLVEEAAFEQ